jgi:Fe-S-cluster containining protein
VWAAIDGLIAASEADAAPSNDGIARSRGCCFCCQMRVVVTASEILRIAAFLEHTYSVEEREALARRVATTDEQTRGMSDEARGEARLPCPLLVANECSVYPVRPLDCRAYNSRSVAACRDAFESYCGLGRPGRRRTSVVLQGRSGGVTAGAGPKRKAGIASRADRSRARDTRGSGRHPPLVRRENVFAAAELSPDDPEQQAFLPWTTSDSLRRAAW